MYRTDKLDWQRILVVVPPELLDAEQPTKSRLVKRAMRVAKQSEASVELFTVCHESSLEQRLFADDDEVKRSRQEIADNAAMALEEISLAFKAANLDAKTEALWHADSAGAILRKIATDSPDLVMAESHEHNYLLGVSANTDWTLVRNSTTPIWFVNSEVTDVTSAMTAIGSATADDEIVSTGDYEVFELADQITTLLGVPNTVVHAYQVPAGVRSYVGYAPYMGPVAGSLSVDQNVRREQRREAAVEHGRMLQKFADHFSLDADAIELVQGLPSDVLPMTAQKLGVELVIMGARNISRWQRATSAVAAEPVLANADCDVLFVKDAEGATVPELKEEPQEGVAEFDIEAAVLNPEGVFGEPAKVVEAEQLTIKMQRRLLSMWRQDIVAEQVAVTEGGPAAQTTDPDRLGEIDDLLKALEHTERSGGASVTELLGRSRVLVA